MSTIAFKRRHGIETVILSNDYIDAVILAGKGADLLEFVWKPTGYNCLYRSDVPFEEYDNLNLHEKRLLHHSDHLLGGWCDALPHRGVYKNIELGQENGGIAATLPWNCKITVKDGEDTNSVLMWVDLPVFPMRVEKLFTLRNSTLFIDESVTNLGDAPIKFTWTQHALFNYPPNTELKVDSDIAFKAWEHMSKPGGDIASYEVDMKKASLSPSEFVVYNHLKKGEAALVNKNYHLEVCLNWDIKRFPYMRSLYQGGLIGLEPGNDLFSGFEHSLKYGTYSVLRENEKIDTSFTLSYTEI